MTKDCDAVWMNGDAVRKNGDAVWKNSDAVRKNGDTTHEHAAESDAGAGEDNKARRHKMVLTLSLIMLWVMMGLYSTLIMLSLPDLRTRFCVTTDSITASMSLKPLGLLVGGVLGGVIVDRYREKSNLFLALGLMVAGTTIMIQPWSAHVELLAALFAVEGVAQGLIDTAGNALVMALWGVKADPAMHAIHAGFTLGMVITPFMTFPFLSPDVASQINCTFTGFDNVTLMTSTCVEYFTTQSPEGCPVDHSQIEIPYFIAGALAVAWSLAFWILFIKGPPVNLKLHSEKKTSFKQVFSPGTCADGDSCYAVAMVILFVFFMIAMTAASVPALSLGFTYLRDTDSMEISVEEATVFAVIVNASQMMGRVLGVAVSHVCPIQVLLMAEVLVGVVAVTLLAFVGLSNKYVFYVSSCVFGLVLSPGWPGGFSWVDKYITLYAIVVALAGVGAGLAGFAATWIAGHMYENVSHDSIFYLSFGFTVFMFLILVAMQILGSSRGTRHNKAVVRETVIPETIPHASTSSLVTKF